MELTTQDHPVPRLRMNGATTPPYTFMACQGALPFTYVTGTRYFLTCFNVTDGVTVTSLPASLQQKISATTDRLCQIALNRKLLHKFEKWCKFSSRVKAK
jgi:hypothetical protein